MLGSHVSILMMSNYMTFQSWLVIVCNVVEIVFSTIQGISGAVARRSVENMADVLYVMVKDGFPIFSTWINELLSNPQFELPLVSKDQRINFGRSLFR